MNNISFLSFIAWISFLGSHATCAGELHGVVNDASSNLPIAARIYVQDQDGTDFHVIATTGEAIPYLRRTGESSEVHTSLSDGQFHAVLPAGKYTVTVERGKEYFPASIEVEVPETGRVEITIPLRRWINMAEQGWYSGETHVHRKVSELPTLLLVEDLNVAFPLTAWVTDSLDSPQSNNKNPEEIPPAKLIEVDSTHVIWPVNTEYEIFSIEGKTHTLGAVFILNHREPLGMKAPPVVPIAIEARRQGAFLDLDKHSWPWSVMVASQMDVDLFELANNHMWRTEFLFSHWYPEYIAEFMDVEAAGRGFTERGWIDFGFQTYYALLNCGFKMRPTAGTASGVHPVPLGFGRVYVELADKFSYEKWVDGLLAGRSFVTTGPMLQVDVTKIGNESIRVSGIVNSTVAPDRVEIIVNGIVHPLGELKPQRTKSGAFRIEFTESIGLLTSSWVAVRTFTTDKNNRPHFAHSAPVHVNLQGKALLPTRIQRDYFVKRIEDELLRHEGVLSDEALQEYRQALVKFQQMAVAD